MSLVMAFAMVVTLVSVAPTTASAASYSISGKTSIKQGTTYTYTVKGVKKTQFIKVTAAKGVTVKYGSTTVKKSTSTAAAKKVNGTGKALKLKVTASDKIKNYKTKLTVKVYNKKNTKKAVKTLNKSATVKVTALKISKVENAASGSTYTNYIRVYFNKALSSLKASEIEIRETASSELKDVEKVTLASNGKSALLQMLGTSDNNNYNAIMYNTPYTLTVTQSGVTASYSFTVDAIA